MIILIPAENLCNYKLGGFGSDTVAVIMNAVFELQRTFELKMSRCETCVILLCIPLYSI